MELRNSEENKRIYLFDNIKFFLMLSVVLGHFIEFCSFDAPLFKGIFVAIYSYHMPLFFFISGIFHKDKDITKKFIFYLSIGFAIKILQTVVHRHVDNGFFYFSLLSDSGLPWFMFALAAITAVCYFLRNQNKIYILIASIVLSAFAGYDKSLGDYLYILRIINFFPFYLIGNLIKTNNIADKLVELKNKYRLIALPGVAVIIIWFAVCINKADDVYWMRQLLTGRAYYAADSLPVEGLAARLICFAVSLILCFALIFAFPAKRIPLISRFGKNTLSVFFWHWSVLIILEHFIDLKGLFDTDFKKCIGAIIFSIIITAVLSLPIFSFPIEFIRKAVFKKQKIEKN